MGQLSQAGRVGMFKTPLGDDVLVLIKLETVEGLGELFEFHIDALSEQANIDFDQALGRSCTLRLKTYNGKERIFDGILMQAQWIGKIEDYFSYRLVLRPWFWLLGHRADSRIFLDKDVKEIIQEVFTKAEFSSGRDFEFRTTDSYDKIAYCVQYRETDLAFVSRLMEEYGIYYFFEHAEGKHTMILADTYSSHKAIPDLPKVPFHPVTGQYNRSEQTLDDWISERRFRTGKVEYNDYDYLNPNKQLRASQEATEKYSRSKFELYDYPGKYDDQDKGKKFAKFRLEAEQAVDHRRRCSGDAPSLYPGGLVTVEKHPTETENREYLVIRSGFSFASQHYRSSAERRRDEVYLGNYELLQSDRPFRSLPLTPKPRIYGIQTAKVVGKKGEASDEEISTDENAHIWVQFYWDREPKISCPVRIAQSWAGKKWGEIFIPRIGMEVVVEFLEGDPDRPLVTGCVYNGDHKVPYDLPGNKTKAGRKSESSKGGNGYNEIVFEDQKGSEQVGVHAEKDLSVVVLNSETREIGEKFMPPTGSASRTTTLKNGDDDLTISMGNQNISIDLGSQTTTAFQSVTLTVGLSTVTLTPASISITAPTINLTAEATINIVSPIINITGVVNITGALTVDGMVPMLLPA